MITRNDGKSSIDGKGHAVQPCGLAALNVTFAQILTNAFLTRTHTISYRLDSGCIRLVFSTLDYERRQGSWSP